MRKYFGKKISNCVTQNIMHTPTPPPPPPPKKKEKLGVVSRNYKDTTLLNILIDGFWEKNATMEKKEIAVLELRK